MTVGSSTVTTIKPGRATDAIADSKKYGEIMTRHGAKNVRTLLLMNSTPMRIVLSYEAENQAALGEIGDKVLADPELQKAMVETFGENGTSGGYITDTWIEV